MSRPADRGAPPLEKQHLPPVTGVGATVKVASPVAIPSSKMRRIAGQSPGEAVSISIIGAPDRIDRSRSAARIELLFST